MANKCHQCGIIYDGWSCPVCSAKESLEQQQKDLQCSMEKSAEKQKETLEESLEEQERMLEEQREAIESTLEYDRLEREYALEGAAARQRKTTSEAWKLQAEAKADRAHELYKASLYKEAIKLCLDAISQDPGNIMAYRYAGWSFEKLGQGAKARYYLEKQISLLKTNYYNNSQSHALRVLKDILEIQKNEDLIQNFLDTRKDYFPADLLDELIGCSLYQSAIKLYFRNISTDILSILGAAYGIELDSYSFEESVGSQGLTYLVGYLKEEPYTERFNIFASFKRVKDSNKFSENTVDSIRMELLKRYEEWKPEIRREFAETADKQAKVEADNKKSPKIIGWIVGIGGYFFWYAFLRSLTIKGIISMVGDNWGLALLFIPPMVAGIITPYLVRNTLKNKKQIELLRSMWKKENETLNTIS